MVYGIHIELLCGIIQGVSVGKINILGNSSMNSSD